MHLKWAANDKLASYLNDIKRDRDGIIGGALPNTSELGQDWNYIKWYIDLIFMSVRQSLASWLIYRQSWRGDNIVVCRRVPLRGGKSVCLCGYGHGCLTVWPPGQCQPIIQLYKCQPIKRPLFRVVTSAHPISSPCQAKKECHQISIIWKQVLMWQFSLTWLRKTLRGCGLGIHNTCCLNFHQIYYYHEQHLKKNL